MTLPRLAQAVVDENVYIKYVTKVSTVRIDPKVHKVLRTLAEESGESMQSILAQAIERERRRRFLKSVNAAYGRLSDEEREEIRLEHSVWDVTLSDGLSDENW